PRLDHEVLEDLVERRPEVNLPVRVRRSVVEDELRRAAPRAADLSVEIHGRPTLERFGLGGLQAGFHGKVGPWQGYGIFPLGHLVILARPYNPGMVAAQPEVTENSTVREHVLDNGLRVLVQEVHTAPLATVWCWYRVGSKDERPGLTGVSHWVEHMNF